MVVEVPRGEAPGGALGSGRPSGYLALRTLTHATSTRARAHDVIVCDECKSIIATLHGPITHRAGVRTARAAKARAMAGQEIDRLSDPLATEENGDAASGASQGAQRVPRCSQQPS